MFFESPVGRLDFSGRGAENAFASVLVTSKHLKRVEQAL
jgi:hypothetical protein